MSMEEKDQEDVVQRLLELGGDKKYLTFDDLNRELPENVVSPDDIEDVLQKLEGSNIPVADSDERLLEQAAAIVADDDDASDEDVELDLSAGALEKTNDLVRLYLREIVIFSEQAELTGDEDSDKAEEYKAWTVEGIQNIRKVFKQGLKEWEKLRVEQKAIRGKKSRKVMRLRRKVARLRLEIAQEI